MTRKQQRPRDTNQLAEFVLDAVAGQGDLPETYNDGKNPDAVALGRLGGLTGGKARARKLSKARRKEIASKAAAARWNDRLRGTTWTLMRSAKCSAEDVMNDFITVEALRLRRQELVKWIAHENGQAAIKTREAELHMANVAEYAKRLDEIDCPTGRC